MSFYETAAIFVLKMAATYNIVDKLIIYTVSQKSEYTPPISVNIYLYLFMGHH